MTSSSLFDLRSRRADGEMIEVHQIAREADDFVFEELEPLADVEL